MSVKSLSLSLESFQSSIKPPSPSLSPLSRIKHYQQQISLAHELIDRLQHVIEDPEKENNDTVNIQGKVIIPRLKIHQKNIASLKLDEDELDSIKIKSFITPREQNRQTFRDGPLSQRNSSILHHMQQSHSRHVDDSKQQQISKRIKINQLKDLIEDIQSEIHQAIEQQSILIRQKEMLGRDIDNVNYEIRVAQNIKTKTEETSNKNKTISEMSVDASTNNQTQKQTVIIKYRKQNITKLTRKMNSQLSKLRHEIRSLQLSQLQSQKTHIDELRQLHQEIVSIKQVNAHMTPNKTNLRILRGDDCIMHVKLDRTRQTSSKRETLEQFRLKTESDGYVLQRDDVSVRSFKSYKSEKKLNPQSQQKQTQSQQKQTQQPQPELKQAQTPREEKQEKNRDCVACRLF